MPTEVAAMIAAQIAQMVAEGPPETHEQSLGMVVWLCCSLILLTSYAIVARSRPPKIGE